MTAREQLPVYISAALASLLLSMWQIAGVQQINHDAVYYLLAIDGHPGAIQQIGNWLFYSRLIEWTATITQLPPEQAAWALNTVLDTLTVLAFIRLTEELGGRRRTLLWAALAILSLPYFNDNRAEIIRDHGYWAFSLVAMLFYLRLFRHFSWKNALNWNIFMFVALLFRVEALAFLLIMPFGLLLNERKRPSEIAMTLAPALVLGGLLALYTATSAGMQNRLVDSLTHAEKLLQAFTAKLPEKARLLRERVVPEFSQGMAEITLYLAVAWSILKDLITSMSWLYFGLLILRRWFPAPGLPTDYRRILWVYVPLTLAILLVHGAGHFIMVSRYTQALALMLLPVAVFALDELHRRYREENRAGGLLAACLLGILVLLADSLHGSARPKAYILQAAEWARQHIPDGSRIVTDYHWERVSWYSNRNTDKHLEFKHFKPGKTWLKDFDYAFVRTGKDMAQSRLYQVMMERGLTPVVRMEPNSGRGVLIFQLKKRRD